MEIPAKTVHYENLYIMIGKIGKITACHRYLSCFFYVKIIFARYSMEDSMRNWPPCIKNKLIFTYGWQYIKKSGILHTCN